MDAGDRHLIETRAGAGVQHGQRVADDKDLFVGQHSRRGCFVGVQLKIDLHDAAAAEVEIKCAVGQVPRDEEILGIADNRNQLAVALLKHDVVDFLKEGVLNR